MTAIKVLLLLIVGSGVLLLTEGSSTTRTHEEVQKDGRKSVHTMVNDEWVEQKDYDVDGNLVQHRYTDWSHSLHEVDYEAGKEVEHRIKQ